MQSLAWSPQLRTNLMSNLNNWCSISLGKVVFTQERFDHKDKFRGVTVFEDEVQLPTAHF